MVRISNVYALRTRARILHHLLVLSHSGQGSIDANLIRPYDELPGEARIKFVELVSRKEIKALLDEFIERFAEIERQLEKPHVAKMATKKAP